MPHIINLLIGSLSLVGPRPPIPYEVDKYKNWHLKRVLEVKPGITGLWDFSPHRNTSIFQDRDMDIYYLNNQSFLLDIIILSRKLLTVFNYLLTRSKKDGS